MEASSRQQSDIPQERWEVEVTYEGEKAPPELCSGCDKNPDHLNFYSVNQFNVKHLPPDCQDNNLVGVVQAMSDLTARLAVEHVSEDRPQTCPGSNKPYPRYANKGKMMTTLGTAFVYGVVICSDKKDTFCTCKECRHSLTPKTVFAYIQLLTATHLVFDIHEGAHTTCHLFYDEGNNPDDCHGVATLTSIHKVWSNIEGDWCRMAYVTHDLELADKLQKMLYHWHELAKCLKTKYIAYEKQWSPRSPTRRISDTWQELVILVSHPHGCSKKVSVGRVTGRHEKEGGLTQYIYTAPTCPGCSGAYVFVFGRSWWVWFDNLVHSQGCCEGNAEVSCSSYGPDKPLFQSCEKAYEKQRWIT